MGEAKRRKEKDPSYAKPKSYMSYLELPYTEGLVSLRELKYMVECLKECTSTYKFYAIVINDHIRRWQKIEKLCLFIGMQKILAHNTKLYNTVSVFVTKTFDDDERSRLISYYSAENMNGYPFPPPTMSKETVKKILENSQQQYEELLEAQDVKLIYKSDHTAAFYIPSDVPTLKGLYYGNFFTKLQMRILS